MLLYNQVQEAFDYINSKGGFKPSLAIILGSGLGPLADEIVIKASLSYKEIPHFFPSTAPGHEGELILGELAGCNVVAMKGRMHLYEGISAAEVAFPVRVMHALGAKSLVVSNACGGLNPSWQAGNLMLHLDFINFTANNALMGPNDERFGPRFPVMFDCYDTQYIEIAREAAKAGNIQLSEGVYLAISGPTYATRAELKMFRAWGADVIGMSSVHEVAVARHQNMRVIGLSVITDMALPDGEKHATGDEVIEAAKHSGEKFSKLVKAVLPRLK